ncbi:ABC transporter substrate-binding protein [Microbacterium sp. X-17]|uniref:ABC transporter substrate-binding protein n=1 Tax=Microbacterium sp. X-17 TaxID=3144404 RepID=UPI0031F56F98
MLTQNKDGSIGPGLATSFGYVGTGNTTFQLTLRDDAKFSDGSPVTADAVKTWMEYAKTAPGNAAVSYLPLASVDASGNSVTLHLSAPDPIVPQVLASFSSVWGTVTSPAALSNPKGLESATAGAGPYMLSGPDTVAGDHYTMVPNPYYYDKTAINFNKVTIKVITSPSTMLQALQAGQLDVAESLSGTTAQAATSAGIDVESSPVFNVLVTLLDKTGALAPPMGDVRVRQALNYAVDRAAISKAVAGTFGTPTAVFATTDGMTSDDQNAYGYDPTKAKSLLSDAGYANGFTMKALCSNQVALVCQAVAGELQAVGIQLDMTQPATTAETAQQLNSATFPVYISQNSVPTTWQASSALFLKGARLNQQGWNDPTIQDLYNKGSVAPVDSGAQYWQQLMHETVTQAAEVPLFIAPLFYFVSDSIGGVSVGQSTDWYRPVVLDWYRK